MAPRNTPIVRLNNISRSLKTNVYCKRDDTNQFGFGGNKIRKLDFLVREAVDNGHDAVVTSGSNQSNWCRMAAAACNFCGLDIYLVLDGPEPPVRTGNLRLLEFLNAEIFFNNGPSDEDTANGKARLIDMLRDQGRNPADFIIGGSSALGALGYVEAMAEIIEYEQATHISFDAVVVAAGSGGTQAGLIAGQELSGWRGDIIGINVSRSAEDQSRRLDSILTEMEALLDTRICRDLIVCNDEHVGGGYGVRTRECAEALRLFAGSEGIFLDEVYTGKAAAGLVDMAMKERFTFDHNVLFIHTGGTPQLFE